MVPKLLIQPIVENALQYGIEGLFKQGVIQIKIYQEQKSLIIIIQDNGGHYQLHNLEQTAHKTQSHHHIGLKNIQGRINLLFGEAGTMEIQSEQGIYTAVTITIPMIENGEEIEYG